MQNHHVEISEERGDGALTLHLTGELDLVSAPELKARLDHLALDGETIILDLAGVEFVDSRGFGVLVEAARSATRAERGFEVRNPTPRVLQVIQLCGLSEVLGLALR